MRRALGRRRRRRRRVPWRVRWGSRGVKSCSCEEQPCSVALLCGERERGVVSRACVEFRCRAQPPLLGRAWMRACATLPLREGHFMHVRSPRARRRGASRVLLLAKTKERALSCTLLPPRPRALAGRSRALTGASSPDSTIGALARGRRMPQGGDAHTRKEIHTQTPSDVRAPSPPADDAAQQAHMHVREGL